MKVLANGGINLSTLDGWWAEAFTPEVGWALGDGKIHTEDNWDNITAEQLYQLLEQEVVLSFYQRDATGIPRGWVALVRASMAKLAPKFSSNRMVREYVEKFYLPATKAFVKRTESAEQAQMMSRWSANLKMYWDHIHWGDLYIDQQSESIHFEVHVYLSDISPEDIRVQIYADPNVHEPQAQTINMKQTRPIGGSTNAYVYSARLETTRDPNDFTPRVVPYHSEVQIPVEAHMISWWSGERRLLGDANSDIKRANG